MARRVNRANTRRPRSGCSGLGTLVFLLLVVGAIVGWPIYLDSHGTSASGVVTEKLESVRIHFGEWYRRFEIVAAYSIPGQPLQRHASCDVDEKTYDSIHQGNTVEVHYFANLLNQPFLPATHLSPCTAMASISWNEPVMRRVVVALGGLFVLLFLWRFLRMRIAAWLLLPWLCFCVAYLGVPRAEPEPEHPVSTTATVESVATITTFGDTHTSKSIPLAHPYQIVRLKYVPSGMDAPVIAIDKVDAGSLPDLQEGQSAKIVYDAEHPRVGRLEGGTRSFPGHTLLVVTLCCVALTVVIVIFGAVGEFFRLIRWGRRQ